MEEGELAAELSEKEKEKEKHQKEQYEKLLPLRRYVRKMAHVMNAWRTKYIKEKKAKEEDFDDGWYICRLGRCANDETEQYKPNNADANTDLMHKAQIGRHLFDEHNMTDEHDQGAKTFHMMILHKEKIDIFGSEDIWRLLFDLISLWTLEPEKEEHKCLVCLLKNCNLDINVDYLQSETQDHLNREHETEEGMIEDHEKFQLNIVFNEETLKVHPSAHRRKIPTPFKPDEGKKLKVKVHQPTESSSTKKSDAEQRKSHKPAKAAKAQSESSDEIQILDFTPQKRKAPPGKSNQPEMISKKPRTTATETSSTVKSGAEPKTRREETARAYPETRGKTLRCKSCECEVQITRYNCCRDHRREISSDDFICGNCAIRPRRNESSTTEVEILMRRYENPSVCPICHQIRDMKEHLKSYHKIKWYQFFECTSCQDAERFEERGQLLRHMNEHHSKKK